MNKKGGQRQLKNEKKPLLSMETKEEIRETER